MTKTLSSALVALGFAGCIAAPPKSDAESPGGTSAGQPASSHASANVPPPSGSRRIVGYFPNWTQNREGCKYGVSDINPSLLTHINVAFAKVDPGPDRNKPKFKLMSYDEKADLGPNGQYAQIAALKAKHTHLKTLISVGGWTFNDPAAKPNTEWVFSALAETAATRAEFIDSAIRFAREHKFDGVDIDWEYPAEPTRGGRPQDTKNFTLLLKEFRAAIEAEAQKTGNAPLLLTIAAPAGAYYFRWLEIAEIHKPLDWINLMTYDYAGPWDGHTGFNAPSPELGMGIPGSVSVYLNFGVPADKIVLGLATYGRSYAGVEDPKPLSPSKGSGPKGRCTGALGMLAYFEVEELIKSGKYKYNWDEASFTPYAYDSTAKVWVTYDDAKSYEKKLDFLQQKGLGGAMIWSLDTDDYKNGYPLVSTIAKRLRGN